MGSSTQFYRVRIEFLPITCSGDMYSTVPSVAPELVRYSSALSNVGASSVTCCVLSESFARPKSRTLARPLFATKSSSGSKPSIRSLVAKRGLLLTLSGTVIGIAVAAGVTRYLETLLYGVRPTDPWTFVGVVILLGIVALVACYLPARRAMRVDPIVALRYE